MSAIITLFNCEPPVLMARTITMNGGLRLAWSRDRSIFCVGGTARPFHGNTPDLFLYPCNANFGRAGAGAVLGYGACVRVL